MVINERKKIVSCDDFELGIERDSKLEYRVSFPSNIKPKAIIFIIPGFGADTDSGYMDKIRDYVAETFSVVVINVFYHCFYSRLNNGATLAFDNFDIHYLKDIIQKFSINFSDVTEITKESVLKKLHSVNRDITISMTLVPKNDEYQNFGVIQAIDHINVLQDVYKSLENCQDIPVVCFGSSHGGYIAQMMAKIAPNSIDYVVDNSSYVKPALQYILGKEINVNKPEFILIEGNLRIHCFVQTYWTLDDKSPYYYSEAVDIMRDISNLEHIKVRSNISKNKTGYTFYHSAHDTIAPIEDKQLLYENLINNGYKVKLHILDQEEDVDGKFIKDLTHGMGMSIKELINRELPVILENYTSSTKEVESLEYICDTLTYSFDIKKSIYKIS